MVSLITQRQVSSQKLKRTFPNKQRGLSGWAMMIITGMVVVYAVVFFKLFPIYMDGWAVKRMLANIETEPKVYNSSKKKIKVTILKRAGMNNIRSLTRDHIYISKTKGVITIQVKYDTTVTLFGNLDGVVHFDKSITANVSSDD